ncbi:MAG: hypothetical protein ACLSHC_14720 [Bilophila wadsworthia]
MDCHVFRRLCDELAPALMGCRIEKIHRPAKDVTLFTLYGTVGKRFLFFRAGRKAPFLFLSTHKIPVGSAPPADIMRLRKYLADRRIIDVLPDWVGRRLYLMSTPIPNAGLRSICGKAPRCFSTRRLSLKFRHGPIPRTGPKPVKATAGGTGRSSRRPCAVPSLCSRPTNKPPCSSIWRPEAEIFSFTRTPPGNASRTALPPERRCDADGTPREDRRSRMPSGAGAGSVSPARHRGFSAGGQTPSGRANRLRKLLLAGERKNASATWLRPGCPACPIAALPFSAEEKHASVTLDGAGGPVDLALDPRLTVRETWRRCSFASRGKRGLSILKAALPPYRPIWPVRSKPGSWHKPRRAPTPANTLSAAPQFRARNCPRTYSRSAAATASCSFGAATPRGTPSFSSWQPRTISGCIPAVGRARTS